MVGMYAVRNPLFGLIAFCPITFREVIGLFIESSRFCLLFYKEVLSLQEFRTCILVLSGILRQLEAIRLILWRKHESIDEKGAELFLNACLLRSITNQELFLGERSYSWKDLLKIKFVRFSIDFLFLLLFSLVGASTCLEASLLRLDFLCYLLDLSLKPLLRILMWWSIFLRAWTYTGAVFEAGSVSSGNI